jgi:hypothetical protein
MADIKITPELKAFMEKYNLDPSNHYAYAELLMQVIETQKKQQEQIDEIAKNTHVLSD